jgi:predicted transcriptional regulator
MSESNVLSVRLPRALKAKVDKVATALDRPRNWVVNRALEEFVAAQAWQLGEIERGLAEAAAGKFASAAEIASGFKSFRPRRRRAG